MALFDFGRNPTYVLILKSLMNILPPTLNDSEIHHSVLHLLHYAGASLSINVTPFVKLLTLDHSDFLVCFCLNLILFCD